jgi:hypothetical protein
MDPSEIMFVLIIVVAVAVFGWKYVARQKAEQRAIEWKAAQRPHVEERLASLEGGRTLDELDPFIGFRSQKGELIYAAMPCYRRQLKTETTGVTYGGPAIRFKVAKGLYIRGAHYKGTRHTEDVVRSLGGGYLVITNKRLAFVAQGDDGNWVRRWSSIVNWRTEGSMLFVEGTSGRPMMFDTDVNTVGKEIPIEYVDRDPKVLNRILEIASGQRPATNQV